MIKVYEFFLSKINPLKHAKKIGVKLGKNVQFTSSVAWGSEPYLISIGDNCRFSQNVTFSNHDGGINVLRNIRNEFNIDLIKPIKIGNNCFIGINSTILYGVTIGDNVIIGAGSIVTKDLESNSVFAGVPAKRICSIDEYYEKNKDMFLPTKNMSSKAKKRYLCDKFYGKKKTI